MNLRVSLVLLVLLALVGSYVFLFELRKPGEAELLPPWFYDVEMQEIQRIVVTHQGETKTYVQAADRSWHFDMPEGTPVNQDKFAGTTLLLSGPRSQRELTGEGLDPALYGLEPPQTVIVVGMTAGRSITFEIGDVTPDGQGQYVRLHGSPNIFIVTSSWGDVLTRLVTEPPYPPTPTPPPEAEATPQA